MKSQLLPKLLRLVLDGSVLSVKSQLRANQKLANCKICKIQRDFPYNFCTSLSLHSHSHDLQQQSSRLANLLLSMDVWSYAFLE